MKSEKIGMGNTLGMFIEITMFFYFISIANASTLIVDDSTGADYQRIQDAINASGDGDTILVHSGIYNENVNVNKKVILRGMITDGSRPVVSPGEGKSAFTISSDGVTLEGFTINGPYSDADISMIPGGNTVNHDKASYDRLSGIFLLSNNNIVKGNNISNNIDSGIYLYFSSNNTISGNDIRGNYPNGILLEQSSGNILSGNNVWNNYDTGILVISMSDNNTLIGNKVWSTIPIYFNSGYGIILDGRNNILSGNNISNNNFGLFLSSSGNNSLKNNNLNENRYNFGLLESPDHVFDNHIDSTNLVNKKPVYFIKGARDTIYDSYTNAGTFYCIDCANITLKDLELKYNKYGIFFWNTTESKIQNVNASSNYHGISLFLSSNNSLTDNYAGFNCGDNGYGHGIRLSSSGNNTLSSNNVSDNCYGLSLDSGSDNNTIINNTAVSNNARWAAASGIVVEYSNNNRLINNDASGNDHGISIYYSNKNIIKDNIISSNIKEGVDLEGYDNVLTGNNISRNGEFYGWSGLYIGSFNNNSIYNNILNNTDNVQFYDSGSNKWNISMTQGINIIGGGSLGGNLWANPEGTGFSQKCSDMNRDGFCDEPYVQDANNTDYLPLSYKTIFVTFSDLALENGTTITQNYAHINTTILNAATGFIDWNHSLIGWWRFNNESGENAAFFRDWSMRGNNAACRDENCPSLTSGKFGNAPGFDGIDDYIDAGNNVNGNQDQITIEAWINPDNAQEKCHDDISGNYGILSKVSSAENSKNWSWQLRYGSPSSGCQLGFNFNEFPQGSKWVSVKQNLTPDTWYHVAGTYNGTHIISYLNGDLKDTKKMSTFRKYKNSLLIGSDGWGNLFKGKIDEVRIHDRALSPEEIKASFNAAIYYLNRNFTNLGIGVYKYRAFVQNLEGEVESTEEKVLNVQYDPQELNITNITAASGKNYSSGILESGKRFYIDRNYLFTEVPSRYIGSNYIMTATNDRYFSTDNFLQFEVDRDVNVYIAYDDRIYPKASWLSYFHDTGDRLERNNTVNFSIFVKKFPAGLISLDGNSISPEGEGGMYVVILN